MALHNDKVTFIYIALFTIQIVKKTLISFVPFPVQIKINILNKHKPKQGYYLGE